MIKADSEVMLDLLESCEAALSFIEDNSKSPRRRTANIEGLQASIDQAKMTLVTNGALHIDAIGSSLPSFNYIVK